MHEQVAKQTDSFLGGEPGKFWGNVYKSNRCYEISMRLLRPIVSGCGDACHDTSRFTFNERAGRGANVFKRSGANGDEKNSSRERAQVYHRGTCVSKIYFVIVTHLVP